MTIECGVIVEHGMVIIIKHHKIDALEDFEWEITQGTQTELLAGLNILQVLCFDIPRPSSACPLECFQCGLAIGDWAEIEGKGDCEFVNLW